MLAYMVRSRVSLFVLACVLPRVCVCVFIQRTRGLAHTYHFHVSTHVRVRNTFVRI